MPIHPAREIRFVVELNARLRTFDAEHRAGAGGPEGCHRRREVGEGLDFCARGLRGRQSPKVRGFWAS